jgi:hypothetical protein
MQLIANRWDLEGARVEGRYMGDYPFIGTVTESRVCYGGEVKHTVRVDEPLIVFGATRKLIMVFHDQIEHLKEIRS